MGLFGGKKKTYVSSVVYPLGEDGDKRTDMLKCTVLNAMLQNKGMGESIRESYLRGQGMSLRSAFLYARDKYADGLPTSSASYMDQPDLAVLGPVLQSMHPGSTIKLITSLLGTGDFAWWAERYLAQSYGYDRVLKRFDAPPKGVEVTANVAYDLEPDGRIQILLMNADGATTVLDYRPDDYTRMASYLHCAYQTVQTFDNGSTESTRAALPNEEPSTQYSSATVERTGETQLTTTKTVVSLSGSMATVVVSQTIEVTSRPKYLLYPLGSGKYPAIDALQQTVKLAAPYFPSVPLRIDNVNTLTKNFWDTPRYKTSKQLLKKVGLKIDELGEKLDTSGSINDIDYAFAVFGVRLNTPSPEGKRYIFRYFSYLRSISQVSSAQYNAWVDDYTAKFPSGPAGKKLPTMGIQAPPTNTVEVYSKKDRANNYDIKLQWQYIDTRLIAGQVKPNAKIGDVEVLPGSRVQFDLLNDMILDGSTLIARRQVDANTFEELVVSGLTYENFIYQGKSVILTAHDTLTNGDEEGFILPLNQEIIRATPLVEVTNLSYQCMYMVLNCYKIVKQKWYQTTMFQIIIVIIAIVITVLSWGSAGPAAGGMVSAAYASAAVAIGITSALMISIFAATMMVLSSMVLLAILTDVSTQLFGEKWGTLIGAIASIVAMNYAATAGSVAGSASTASQSTLFTAQNIIAASSAVMQTYVGAQLKGIAEDISKLASDYKTGMAKVVELTKEYLSTNLDVIDVSGFTQAAYQMNYEMPSTFLTRTLMTGSDICDVTAGMVENFADVGLQLPGQA